MLHAQREFAVRFLPSRGGSHMPMRAYVQAMDALCDGLTAIRSAVAPQIARRVRRPTVDVSRCLEFDIGAVEAGSIVNQVVLSKPPSLDPTTIHALFWRDTALNIRLAATGSNSVLSGNAAMHFARASGFASDGGAAVELVHRRRGQISWVRSSLVSQHEKHLREYAARRGHAMRVFHQFIGRMDTLTHDVPGFSLIMPSGRITIKMRPELRERARSAWGKSVIVDADVDLDQDGKITNPTARDIRPSVTVTDTFSHLARAFGAGRQIENNRQAAEYIDDILGGDDS